MCVPCPWGAASSPSSALAPFSAWENKLSPRAPGVGSFPGAGAGAELCLLLMEVPFLSLQLRLQQLGLGRAGREGVTQSTAQTHPGNILGPCWAVPPELSVLLGCSQGLIPARCWISGCSPVGGSLRELQDEPGLCFGSLGAVGSRESPLRSSCSVPIPRPRGCDIPVTALALPPLPP